MVWPFIILAYTSLFALGFCDNLRGPLLPEIMASLNLTDSMASWIFATASAFGFLGGFSSHKILEKRGEVFGIRLGLILLSLACFLMANSLSFTIMIIASAIFGYAMGPIGVVQNLLVLWGAPKNKLQQVQSGLHSVYGLASFVAPGVVNLIYYFGGDWRKCLMAGGLVPLILLPLTRNLPEIKMSDDTLGEKKSSMAIVFFAIMLAFYVVAEIMISTRLALYLRRDVGYELQKANFLVALFFAFMLGGRFLFIFKKFDQHVSLQLKFSIGFSILFILLGLNINPLFLTLTGLSMAPFYPLSMTYASELFSANLRKAISYAVAIGSLMIVCMHLSIGYISELVGLRMALYFGPIALGLSFLLLIMLPSRIKKYEN